MRKLLREFWLSWHTWVFLGSILVAMAGLAYLGLTLQRRDYQRTLDTSAIRTIEQIRVDLKAIDRHLEVIDHDRAAIRRDVNEVRKAVDQ